jgi:hypothetical protein
MRKLDAVIIAALLSTAAFAAYAADDDAAPTVQQSGNPMDESGQGAPQDTGTGAVEEGVAAQQGREDPSGASTGDSVSSPIPTGPGRGDNQ